MYALIRTGRILYVVSHGAGRDPAPPRHAARMACSQRYETLHATTLTAVGREGNGPSCYGAISLTPESFTHIRIPALLVAHAEPGAGSL